MKAIFDTGIDIGFGGADIELPDWRNEDELDVDIDDEELSKTPEDVVAVLGFDPKD